MDGGACLGIVTLLAQHSQGERHPEELDHIVHTTSITGLSEASLHNLCSLSGLCLWLAARLLRSLLCSSSAVAVAH